MKNNIFICCLAFLFALSCSSESNDDFVSLFNGRDLTNWTLANPDGFEVVLGELITRSYGSGTDIYTNNYFGNFILRLEFFLSEVGNSGVFIRRNPAIRNSGFEVQILAPWTPWRPDLYCTGSLYGHVAVANRPDETPGVWHKMEIKCDRNIITVSVNDEITTVADIDTVETLKGKPFTGLIGLQGNHGRKGQYAKFRNIYIRDLDSEPDYVTKGFYDENDQRRNLALAAAIKIGAKMVHPLADIMSGDDPIAKSGAKQALFDIVAKTSDPEGPEKEKREVRAALDKSIKSTSSEITINYLKWLSGLITD